MKFFQCIILGVLFMIGSNLLADENYITVYNQDLALIKQVREVEIQKSALPLRFTDVAASLIPTSVHLRSLSGNKNFRVVEQNFEYDLVSSDKILEKYIDHPLEIIKENGELIQGTLLSRSGGSLVLKTDEGIKIIPWNDKMSVTVKELPEGLITRPTLIWELSGVKEGKEKLEVSYLSSGMSWQAEYVGVLSESGDAVNLDAWVSLDNHCGATFKDAHLKLVAGDIHRAPVAAQPYAKGMLMEMAAAEAEDRGFQEREFFEYHIYELDRLTTLKDKQIKQIALFPPANVASQKRFVYNANRDAKKIEVKVIFKNEEKSGLGKPLPAGIFRIYQKDEESLEFVGEDRIDHTGRNEEVKITVGKAFDLVGERRVVEQKKVSQRSERQTIEIELRNNKEKEDVTILVEESFYYRDWKIEESNYPYTKKDIRNCEFSIPVKADNKSTLRYTVLYSW
jgi:hypothetical protein